ncbi:MAG TPA: haloacid dehalogenase type II [Candidatus Acidoferrales bacterium]|nr:haloacid dehalogenase type II [Candidatus Acidoferrales bacterium]
MRRREFLGASVALGSFTALSTAKLGGRVAMSSTSNSFGVKALTFDVFGTVVDWRGSIIREGTQWGQMKGLEVDWAKFADRWRAGYGPSMDKVRKGSLPWMKIDELHRFILDDLLTEFNITGLTEEEKNHWNRVWHRLTPWPDAVEGLTRLKKSFIISTLSNGNVSLLVEGAKFGGLPWDMVLSAELFHHYKPDREVYIGAADLLGCQTAEVMMVAAHPNDLKASHAGGLRTAFVSRPLENGPGKEAASMTGESFDVMAHDFMELADKLGVAR